MISLIKHLAAELAEAVPSQLADLPAYLNCQPRADINPDVISKLLLNSWSAEYALRITPVLDSQEFVRNCKGWTFPQVYYSCLFSARAFVFATQRISIYNEEMLTDQISSMPEYYPVCLFEGEASYFDTLDLFRLTSADSKQNIERAMGSLTLDDIRDLHSSLVILASQINLVHEAYICKILGHQAYTAITAAMPLYLQESFVYARYCRICALETELVGA